VSEGTVLAGLLGRHYDGPQASYVYDLGLICRKGELHSVGSDQAVPASCIRTCTDELNSYRLSVAAMQPAQHKWQV
jgi:hypothetical protein